MIKSTNTLNIDGTGLNREDFVKTFSMKSDDKFTRWVVRPLALVAAAAIGVSMLFASFFFIVLSLMLVPILAVLGWAIKTKLEKSLAEANPVVDTQVNNSDNTDAQAAI